MRKLIAVSFCALILGSISILEAQARVKVVHSVEVKADLKSTWEALQKYQREGKLFHKEVISDTGNRIVLKEEFLRVPVVGNAYINYVEDNHPYDRVDYKLQGSKVLTVFEGAWKLENVAGKNSVLLTLITDIDSWVPVPFKNSILKKSTSKGMKERLAFVKKQAELIDKSSKLKNSAQILKKAASKS